MLNTLILSKETLSCISFVNKRVITELRVNYKHPCTASIILDDVAIKSIKNFMIHMEKDIFTAWIFLIVFVRLVIQNS